MISSALATMQWRLDKDGAKPGCKQPGFLFARNKIKLMRINFAIS